MLRHIPERVSVRHTLIRKHRGTDPQGRNDDTRLGVWGINVRTPSHVRGEAATRRDQDQVQGRVDV